MARAQAVPLRPPCRSRAVLGVVEPVRMPWQVRQSYLHDVRAMRWSRIDDGVLGFGTAATPP